MEDSWLEETPEEVVNRNELVAKLTILSQKASIWAKSQEHKPNIKHVKFKRQVTVYIVTRVPHELWYDDRDYIDMAAKTS